jgi:hypothetical protein
VLHSTTHKGASDKPLPTSMERVYGEGNLCAGGPVSHHHRLRTECTYSRTTRSCARSVRRARRSQCGVPQLALRALSQMTACRLEVAPVADLSNVATPTRAIITIPITLYGYGNGDNAEEGGPERRRNGREHGEHERDKARRCSRLVRLAPRASIHRGRDLESRHEGTVISSIHSVRDRLEQ